MDFMKDALSNFKDESSIPKFKEKLDDVSVKP